MTFDYDEIEYPTSGGRVHYYAEYVRRPRKDGKPGKRIDWRPVYYCPLYVCTACGERGGSHRIQYRSLLAHVLCMGCWNRLRVIERDQAALDAIGVLARKLMRTRYDHQHG